MSTFNFTKTERFAQIFQIINMAENADSLQHRAENILATTVQSNLKQGNVRTLTSFNMFKKAHMR